jgi:hypothetical protein
VFVVSLPPLLGMMIWLFTAEFSKILVMPFTD